MTSFTNFGHGSRQTRLDPPTPRKPASTTLARLLGDRQPPAVHDRNRLRLAVGHERRVSALGAGAGSRPRRLGHTSGLGGNVVIVSADDGGVDADGDGAAAR